MNPRLEKIKQKIANGQPVVGVFVELADASISEIVGYSGCDFAWIDTEHGMMDRREVYQHVMAAQSAGACAFVRVPGVDRQQVKHLLDMGPDGVIFPFVNSPEIAREAVAACNYPSEGGGRGIGPLRAIKYGIDSEPDYWEIANDEVWKIFQIESMEAIPHLEEIAAVPGFHSLFVGPADLGMSMVGVPAEEKGKRTREIQIQVGELARKYGKYAGSCAGPTKESCHELMSRGMQWMTIAQDARILSGMLMEAVKNING